MERETTIITVGSHTFKVKTYATAREHNAILAPFYQAAKAEMVGNLPKFANVELSFQYQMRLEMIRQMVVEMDESTANIVERCEQLPIEEFDALSDAIDNVLGKKKSS